MSSEMMYQIPQTIEEEMNSRPSAIEFVMAYHARVAMDRIRFAIKHTEQFAPRTDPMREVGLRLLDALERLQTVDRRFQERSRILTPTRSNGLDCHHPPLNGNESRGTW